MFFLVPRYSGGHIRYAFRLTGGSPEVAEAALEAWLLEKGFARVSEDTFQAPASPPFRVVLAKTAGDLCCAFDWSYQDYSWFESEDHQRARAFSGMLKAWRAAYPGRTP